MLERCPCTRYNYRYEVAQGARDRQRHFRTVTPNKFKYAKVRFEDRTIEVTMVESRDAKMSRVYTQCGYSWCERGLPSIAPRRASSRRCSSPRPVRHALTLALTMALTWRKRWAAQARARRKKAKQDPYVTRQHP